MSDIDVDDTKSEILDVGDEGASDRTHDDEVSPTLRCDGNGIFRNWEG